MIPRQLNQALGTAAVETLLALSPPRLFAAIGKQDWYSGIHQGWIDEHDFGPDDRVLEVGCATGALTKWHRNSPKSSKSQLDALLRSVDLEPA